MLRWHGSRSLLRRSSAVALAQQHRAAGFEFLRDMVRIAGRGDFFSMSLGLLGGTVDFGGAVADRDK